MELRHLRYFIAVAEEAHITRAAERLGMQQPPLSQQIKALEHELGVQLLRRKPRGVELTEAGRALLDDARAILLHIDHAFATTRRTARGELGRIAVGFTSSAPFHPFVPRVIRAFREAFPLVSLTLEESGTTELIADLRNERVDAAFIRTNVAEPIGLTVNPLLEEAMLVAMPEYACSRRRTHRRGQTAATCGPRRRDLCRLSPPQWPRSLRCHLRGLPRRRLQPCCWPGGSAHRFDAESGRRRPGHRDRSRLPATNANGRGGLSAARRHRTATRAIAARDTPQRYRRGGSPLPQPGQADGTDIPQGRDTVSAHILIC